jgi:hypothetical protein
MKTHRSLWLVPAVAALLAVSVSLAAAPSTDISWIGRLPGITNAVQSQDGDAIKVVYQFSGDTERMLQRITTGLEDRDWSIKKGGLAALGVTSLQTITATKGRAKLTLAVADEGATRVVIAHLYNGTTDPPATVGERRRSGDSVSVDSSGRVVVRDADGDTVTSSGGRVVAKDSSGQTAVVTPGGVVAKDSSGQTVVVGTGRVAAGRRITINEDETMRRVQCDATTEVIINSNDCKITLEGNCASLSVKGNDNRADVLGSIEVIKVLGNGNLVVWSADANPTRPRVENLGNENIVRASSH